MLSLAIIISEGMFFFPAASTVDHLLANNDMTDECPEQSGLYCTAKNISVTKFLVFSLMEIKQVITCHHKLLLN